MNNRSVLASLVKLNSCLNVILDHFSLILFFVQKWEQLRSIWFILNLKATLLNMFDSVMLSLVWFRSKFSRKQNNIKVFTTMKSNKHILLFEFFWWKFLEGNFHTRHFHNPMLCSSKQFHTAKVCPNPHGAKQAPNSIKQQHQAKPIKACNSKEPNFARSPNSKMFFKEPNLVI